MDRIPWYPGTRHISRWGEKVVRLILSSVSLSNNIVYDNNGSIAGRKRAFINPTLYFKQRHFHTGRDSRKKATKWSASQLHMNFPNCRLKLQHYVVPALVETALNMGNAGVTAVTQIHRSLTLKPTIIINIIIIATIVTMIVTMIVTTLNDNQHKGEQSQQPQSQQLTSITLSPSILRPPSLLLEGL